METDGKSNTIKTEVRNEPHLVTIAFFGTTCMILRETRWDKKR